MTAPRILYEKGEPIICHCGKVLTTSHAHCTDCDIELPPDNAGKCRACANKPPEPVRCKRCRSTDRINANGCISNFHAENREENH